MAFSQYLNSNQIGDIFFNVLAGKKDHFIITTINIRYFILRQSLDLFILSSYIFVVLKLFAFYEKLVNLSGNNRIV